MISMTSGVIIFLNVRKAPIDNFPQLAIAAQMLLRRIIASANRSAKPEFVHNAV
jgi:hypothetical protein